MQQLFDLGAGAMIDELDSSELLAASGWRADRQTDVREVLSALEKRGYSVGPGVSKLAANLDGIVVEFVRGGRPDRITFDPLHAVESTFPSWVEWYSTEAGRPLVPMGFSAHEHLLLLVGEDGRWFGGFDEAFGYLGENVLSLIDGIVNERGFGPSPA